MLARAARRGHGLGGQGLPRLAQRRGRPARGAGPDGQPVVRIGRRAGPRAHRRAGQVARGRQARGAGCRGVVQLLRRARRAPGDHPGRRRRLLRGDPPAAGCGCRHHPVELPADPGLVEDRPGPAGRQHHGAQAFALHPADHAQARGAAARRAAPRRAERGERRRRPGRLDDLAPRAPQDQLHRLGGHRQAGGRGRGARPQARHPRAGRQRPGHRARRRGAGRRGREDLLGCLLQQRADLLGHQAGVRARSALRRDGRRPGRAGPVGGGGRRRGRGHPAGARSTTSPSSIGSASW